MAGTTAIARENGKKGGRPKGSTTRPQFYEYVDEPDREAFVIWVKENYKEKPELAKWFGDQLFGKAPQTMALTDPEGNALTINLVNYANGDDPPQLQETN